MSGVEGFGPTGPGAADAAPFSVTGPSELKLDAARTAKASFEVVNQTGRSVRARMFVQPGPGADASWFSLEGEPEQTLAEGAKAAVEVTLAVRGDAAAGPASFALGTALEEAPDRVVSSPPVAFDVPAGRRRFPWWIVIVAVVAVLVLAGGGILIFLLTRPGEPEPTSPPTSSPTEGPFLFDDFFVDTSAKQVDLDNDGTPDIQVTDADLAAIPADRPTTVFGLMRGLAIVDDPTPEACRDVVLESSVQVGHFDSGVFVCVFTSGRHSGFLEFGPTQDDQTRQVVVTLQE